MLSSADVYSVPGLHEKNGLIHKVSGDASLQSYVPCMEVHMATLDAFNRHRPDCREVLGEANRNHDLGKFFCIWVPHYLMCIDVGWVCVYCATLSPHRNRHL